VAIIEEKNANLIIPLKEKKEGKVMLSFLGPTICRVYVLVWPVPLAQVLPRPQLIFPSKPGFWEFV